MSQKILITGATGLIGSRLTSLLLQKGYQVFHLGRTSRNGAVPGFVWDIENGLLDTNALEGVDTIIHLAGAGIADKRWSARRKREIRESRTRSTRLLFDTLNKSRHQVKNFIAASAIGYYGFENNDQVFHEDDRAGSDFLSSVVKDWEQEIDQVRRLDIRVVKIRIGIVLTPEGGALKEIARPIRLGFGAPLGTGKQVMSWIHLDDLCNLFLYATENQQMEGAYNAVTPYPATNLEFTRVVAATLHRPLWLPPVPGFVLRLLVGEVADLVINGSNVSPSRIQQVGFQFQFPELEKALNNLLLKQRGA
jgi:uncharacterized protein